MKLTSYWLDTVPRFTGTPQAALPGQADAVIVGGGFSGLSAALRLRQLGASVVVLERDRVIGEASGRNGGHVNNGLAGSFTDACAKLGEDTATRLYKVLNSAVDTVETITRENGIDCDFTRCGKLKVGNRQAHEAALQTDYARLTVAADPEACLLDETQVREELGSDLFSSGLLYPKSARMHMGRFGIGLANAVLHAGGLIFENTPMTGMKRTGNSFEMTTPQGKILAKSVLMATGISRNAPAWFRQRIMPVGSFIVATEPMDEAAMRRIMPGGRNVVTMQNIHNYFRATADHRLIFGGRASFSRSRTTTDITSGNMLLAAMRRTLPELPDVKIDYCWGGDVDMTVDRLPHAGQWNGVFYTMGYSGHGTQMSVYMGQRMAEAMAGMPDTNPLAGRAWQKIPCYGLASHFLPLVGAFYRAKDFVQEMKE
ncbi:NAD(P)/FAD-dependent oxidoreductase [Acetobacter oeni]|uniref:Oxidoreductase n=1 Tax=Acetobacter oeni TaxID=304077 RepID=A0A511XNS3_9PROT|nr:FAD-binding oxidoreductase [Acetobacter oeni]MBB3884406.1 glycine/D-amino acid oxidase-like deaminating enzyme [Acetobacter oeni]NHO20372.1 FAD-dependent oxidoreductase [Acetobacter oeni]GBR09858.1 FAD dependent oxidoreductase [Acetobacter oeni LMG 21952]GEN64593.1 oxidoreductase [Acetobacter oeni]